MKQLRNYKYIRREPVIYGFSPNGFYVFVGVGVASLLYLSSGLNMVSVCISAVFILIGLFFGYVVMSNNSLSILFKKRFSLSKKFQKEINDLTKSNDRK